MKQVQYLKKQLKHRLKGHWRPSNRDYISLPCNDVLYEEVFAKKQSPQRVSIDDVAGRQIRFNVSTPFSHPSLGVFTLTNAQHCLSGGNVLNAQGKILKQNSFYAATSQYRFLAIHPKGLKKRDLAGASLSLCSEFSDNNYCHFLLDCIGRLAIFTQVYPGILDEVEHILLPGAASKWKEYLVEQFSIPIHKVIWLGQNDAFNCERLFVASYPNLLQSYWPWLINFLKNNAKSCVETAQPHRRLFLTRGRGLRKLANEENLFELLRPLGFEKYQAEHSADQIKDFTEAECVISPHGAGLTNITFMKNNTKVLELLPSDHRHRYFYSLAMTNQLEYHVLEGKSESQRSEGAWGPSPYDFTIDESEFEKALFRLNLV